MKKTVQWLILIAAGHAGHAQVAEQVRRATLSGTGSASGKCTIEVRVDSSSEIDLNGDSGRLRTIAGQPAAWGRLECTSVMPHTMSDFRFRGIDGRGSVKLVLEPRNNNSMAVIRIDDPRGGAEGYSFEVSWSGGSADGTGERLPALERLGHARHGFHVWLDQYGPRWWQRPHDHVRTDDRPAPRRGPHTGRAGLLASKH